MNILFLASMIVEAIMGIGFILAPGVLLGPMGVTLDATSTTFARLFGSAIISFPFLLWLVRQSDKAEFRMGVVYTMFVYYLLSDILLLMAELGGQMNAVGWGAVLLHAVFTLWFGYFVVKKIA